MRWSQERWREVLPQAKWVGNPQALEQVETFFIDSRTVPDQGMFVPLKGENTDGHRFLSAALMGGAIAAFCSRSAWANLETTVALSDRQVVVVVDDVLEALTNFASAHLDEFPGTLRIGITGSNGKTTTKELMASALSVFGPTYSSRGNFNSEIGLPLMALQMTSGFRFAVFEMGVNHRGEMDQLASIVRPLVSVITNIGTAHIGIIGSQLEIALEKKKIFSRSGSVAMAVLPGSDRHLPVLSDGFGGSIFRFGRSEPGYRLIADRGLSGSEFEWKGHVYTLALPGLHHIDNALAVLTTVEALGLDPRRCSSALASVGASFGRGQVLHGEVELLLDCYNANYDSMVGLLGLLKDLRQDRRIVLVLGSMKELGAESPSLHDKLGKEVARLDVAGVFFFGDEAEGSYQACVAGRFSGHLAWTNEYSELESMVREFVHPGDLVVLKGSRSNELERLQVLWDIPREAAHVL